MKRQDILDRLAAHRDELRSSGVKSIALFGSAARDEATDTNDVDLLVEFDRPTELLALIRFKHRLRRCFRPTALTCSPAMVFTRL